jgi:hypothetical protein
MVSGRIIGITAALLIVVGFAIYFTIISPVVEKPNIPKPEFTGEVETVHVQWLVNELGAYKIHASPTGEEAIMEFVVDNSTFTVTNEEGVPEVVEGSADDPDIRITADQQEFIQIFTSEDLNAEVITLYNQGEIGLEILGDETDLALKGYLGVYEELS